MAVSLRRTLALRFGLTMAVALLGITLWAHAAVRRTLREQMDRSLRTSLELQTRDLLSEGRITSIPTPSDPDAFVREVNRLVLVRDSAGRILQTNNPLALDLPTDSSSIRRARGGEHVLRSGSWRGTALRSITGPVPPGGPPEAAVLQVAASLGPVEAAGRELLYRILAIAALGTLATLVGAWWLARSALAPVGEIAAQADAVQGDTPGRRITAHADVQELQGLIGVLNAMLDRLERTAEWHRRIIRDLGHDLRTPITTMRAGVELALTTSRSPDEYRRVLASALEEIDRLTLIADALRLLGRLESGALEAELRRTDLRTVLGEAAARARSRVGGHVVRFEAPTQAVEAPVDPGLIEVLIEQLIDNAMRHTPAGTPVELSLATANGAAIVTVEDEGGGVPDELLPRLFEPFYRGDAARGREGVAGLGLTVASAIVGLHRGRIAAERGRTGGLRVRIELPV